MKRRIRMKARATPEAGDGTFEAVVSTYGVEYDVGWGWSELILPGCFTDSITNHPTIPIFYNHQWGMAPIGSAKPEERGDQLVVAGGLYLGMGDLVGRTYQAMLDEALEEWSVGFWAEQLTWTDDNPLCDQIIRGDLAEASVCIRGANPETGTLELNSRATVYIAGDEPTRQREVARVRAIVEETGGGRQRSEPPKERADCPGCGHPADVHQDTDDGDNTGACTTPGCDCTGTGGGARTDSLTPEQARRAWFLREQGWPREALRL